MRPGRLPAGEVAARLTRPVEISLVAVLRFREPPGLRPDFLRASAIGQRGKDSGRETFRRRLGQERHLVVEHLCMREEPRGDDRTARAQVLIDLQRRVGAVAAWLQQHVGGIEVIGNLFGGPLSGKHDAAGHARGARQKGFRRPCTVLRKA